MRVNIECPSTPLPVERAFVVTAVIRSFKGRRDVEVHLFRPDYDIAETAQYDWDKLLGPPPTPEMEADAEGSKRILLEAFIAAERDMLVEYLRERYSDRLTSIDARPMSFPIPTGLTPLSAIPEGKTVGLIRFDAAPNFTPTFAVRGLYDLSRHEPLVRDGE